MLKNLIKRAIFYNVWRKYSLKAGLNLKKPHIDTLVEDWIKNDRPAPPPHPVKLATIKEYARLHESKVFVETGTYLGETTAACLDAFEQLITIELDEKLYNNAAEKFSPYKKVSVYRGDSGDVLAEVLPSISKPTLFWLDGHYSEGFTAKGRLNTPILNELKHIFAHPIKGHTILIDDARCFTGEDDYPTIDYLRTIAHGHDRNLLFSVHDDIIRIHTNRLADIHYSENSIYSSAVQRDSLLGNHIEVREGTAVDKQSKIGSYTYIGNRCNVTKTTIGRYCSIGDNVTIGPGEHNLSYASTSAIFYEDILKELTKQPCEIGNDVWIGVDSVIKRGVKIGDGAVIGANSVVTKDVPPFAIVAGSPAKILRFRFEQSQIDKLTSCNWWNVDVNQARDLLKNF